MKYLATNKLRFKMATGIYSQNFIAANSDRDVVNLFYGFLSGPENLPTTFDGKEVTSKLQKAQHIIIGAEIDVMKNMLVNIEAYYKNFSQLTNINRNKIYEDIGEYQDKPEYLRKDFIIENGSAKGIDFSMKYENKNLYLWVVYSLGYVNRYDGLIHYVPHYDRRHNVNVVASYKFGKLNTWEFNGRWNLGSGFPFTQTQGYYEKLNFAQGIFSDITTMNGDLSIIYGTVNGGRLSYYHRLDLGLTKKFSFSENVTLDANFTVTNVYDRDNIFYVNRITNEKVYQLPVMPSFGLTLNF
jgi:hypothetical protein